MNGVHMTSQSKDNGTLKVIYPYLVELIDLSLADAKVDDVSTYERKIDIIESGIKKQITEFIKICTAKSTRHLNNIGLRVMKDVKHAKTAYKCRIYFNNYNNNRAKSDWLCFYLSSADADITLHIMEAHVREEYNIDDLLSQDLSQSITVEDIFNDMQKRK